MNPVDIILIALIALALFFAVRHMVRQKKSGGSSRKRNLGYMIAC